MKGGELTRGIWYRNWNWVTFLFCLDISVHCGFMVLWWLLLNQIFSIPFYHGTYFSLISVSYAIINIYIYIEPQYMHFFCFCRTPSCHQASNTSVLGPIKMMINNMLRTYGRLVGDFLLCRSLTLLILWLSGPGALRYQDNCKNGIGCAGRSVIFFLWYGFTKLQSSKCN